MSLACEKAHEFLMETIKEPRRKPCQCSLDLHYVFPHGFDESYMNADATEYNQKLCLKKKKNS